MVALTVRLHYAYLLPNSRTTVHHIARQSLLFSTISVPHMVSSGDDRDVQMRVAPHIPVPSQVSGGEQILTGDRHIMALERGA